MSDKKTTGEVQDKTEEPGSALRKLILKSRLNIERVQSYSPLHSEYLGYSANARKLLQDFETLKEKFLDLEQKLDQASPTVRRKSEGQTNNARDLLERLTNTDVGTSNEDRQARQKKVDALIDQIDDVIRKIGERTKVENELIETEQKREQARQEQIEQDRTLIESIGTGFDTLQNTYGDKLEKARSERINGLRKAFGEVAQGTRPLSEPERISAIALRDTDGPAWTRLYDSHAGLVGRLDDEDTKPPSGALEQERSGIEGQREEVTRLLAKHPVLEKDVQTATQLIGQIVSAVQLSIEAARRRQEEARKRSERAAEILKLLQTSDYATPEGASEPERQTLGKDRETITRALAETEPSAEQMTLAEKTLQSLGEAVTDMQQAIVERQRQAQARSQRAKEILGLLTTGAYAVPEGIGEQQSQELGTLHETITGALKQDPPGVETLDLAEQTLKALSTGVEQARKEAGEAALAEQRPKLVLQRLKQIDFKTFGPLLKGDPEFKAGLDFLKPMFGAKAPATLTETQFGEAETHLAAIEKRIAERQGDFESQKQSFEQWLRSFRYLDGQIVEVSRKDNEQAKQFTVSCLELRLLVQQRLQLPITEFDDKVVKDVDQALSDLNALAMSIADAITPPSGGTTTFDWQDATTWTVKPIRYMGAGTKDYVEGLSGADPGMIDRISQADVGDRHSAAKICTGKPMHQHTDSGSGGISFAYGHLGGTEVEPVIYDYADKRQGNTYEWRHGGDSNGPSGLPGSVKARA